MFLYNFNTFAKGSWSCAREAQNILKALDRLQYESKLIYLAQTIEVQHKPALNHIHLRSSPFLTLPSDLLFRNKNCRLLCPTTENQNGNPYHFYIISAEQSEDYIFNIMYQLVKPHE